MSRTAGAMLGPAIETFHGNRASLGIAILAAPGSAAVLFLLPEHTLDALGVLALSTLSSFIGLSTRATVYVEGLRLTTLYRPREMPSLRLSPAVC